MLSLSNEKHGSVLCGAVSWTKRVTAFMISAACQVSHVYDPLPTPDHSFLFFIDDLLFRDLQEQLANNL